MNVISCEAAYSLYPKATFEQRSSLVTRSRDRFTGNTEDALCKYDQRGFNTTFQVNTALERRSPAFFNDKYRYIEDSHCWKISLDTKGITQRIHVTPGSQPFECDPVVASGWQLWYGVYDNDDYVKEYSDYIVEFETDDGGGVRGAIGYSIISKRYLACSYIAPQCPEPLGRLDRLAIETKFGQQYGFHSPPQMLPCLTSVLAST